LLLPNPACSACDGLHGACGNTNAVAALAAATRRSRGSFIAASEGGLPTVKINETHRAQRLSLQKGLSRRELRFVQAMRRKKMTNVIMIESLWDMTEDTIGVHYGQYADMKQAAVVVGATVDGGRGG
jgi:hypothetical protein